MAGFSTAECAPIWIPDATAAEGLAIERFAARVSSATGRSFASYAELWAWSVEDLEGFWDAVWKFFDVRADGRPSAVLAEEAMPGASWFPGARLNYAEHVLRHADDPVMADHVAVTSVAEDGFTSTLTWSQLGDQVAALAQWLRTSGVQPGVRVVGYLPNSVPALIAFLATASVGAVWSCCAQDYSAAGAADRFAQLEPVVLFAADGYAWNGTWHDRRDEVAKLERALPSLRTTVHVPSGLPAAATAGGERTVTWDQTLATPADPQFDRVAFDAPLWVLFSSGTTGLPKGIVHGHGGVVLEHCKLLGLHLDLGPDDALFWYTTTNWMMWNVVVSGLLTGAQIVLYDGSPSYPETARLWQIAAQHQVTVMGVSPGYLAACAKANLASGADFDLRVLRTLGSTGAPLLAPAYHWVRDHIGPGVQLASTSGGTDIASAFAGSAPTTPVWPGEISAPSLGVALAAWDGDGQPVFNQVGELVVTRPMPSMPVSFWNDPDGSRYRDAYFSTYPGVWRHGDLMTVTDRGSVIVSGRSDVTLNRHGVRLGSADIYRIVDELPEVRDSLVIGAELADGGYWLALFVVLLEGEELDGALTGRITKAIAEGASPRHVPDDVIAVSALPHTRTGKRLELPVKRLIQGHALVDVAAPDAVDDFAALAQFTHFARVPSR